MGFKKDAYATVWGAEQVGNSTKVQLSTSRKNKDTGKYETDFSGFVMFYGTANATKAAKLKRGDRIKIGDTDVTTKYDAQKKVTYTNFKAFGFESVNTSSDKEDPQPEVDSGEVDDSRLPF